MPNREKNLFARIASVVGGVLVVWFVGAALFGANGVARHERLESELDDLVVKNAALVGDNRRLASEARALRTDKRYLEQVIRDELGWVRGDELVLIFPGGDER